MILPFWTQIKKFKEFVQEKPRDEKRARNAAKKACRRHLKGTYVEREVRTKCYNIGSLLRKKTPCRAETSLKPP